MSVSPDLHIPIIRLANPSDKNYVAAKDNLGKLCLVYEAMFSTEECNTFLEKVFKAVEIDFEVQISKLHLEEIFGITISQHPSFQQHEILISFGPSFHKLGLKVSVKKYVPIEFKNKRLLWVDNPKEILENPILKKQLWVNIQQLFLDK